MPSLETMRKVEYGENILCTVIGTIETPYKRIEDCPNRHNKKEKLPCIVRLEKEFAEGLDGIVAGSKATVLYWLHNEIHARRDMLKLPIIEGVRDKSVGVFSTRTRHRPNPIAISEVTVNEVRENELDVIGLDCLDGTPLLDLKQRRKI